MNHNKLPKLTLDKVSPTIHGRRLFKGMKMSAVILPALTLALTATAQTGADKVSGPMRKYGGSQLVRVEERPSLDVMRAYRDLAQRVPAHLLSEVSCYMSDYIDEWFVNGRKLPGAPFPSQYCWNRFYADVNAGKKVPLHLRYIVNAEKAQEQFFKSNPHAHPQTNKPSPNPEWDKIDEKFGRTNASTNADTTDKNTKKEEGK